METFINEFQFHSEERSLNKKLLIEYAAKQVQRGLMDDWNIVIISKKSDDLGSIRIGEDTINCINRSKLGEDRTPAQLKTVSSKDDLLRDLSVLDPNKEPNEWVLDDYRRDYFRDEVETLREKLEPKIVKLNDILKQTFLRLEKVPR